MCIRDRIKGGKSLHGEVKVSGAKNAVLPLMVAPLLSDEECIVHNVPSLEDIWVFLRLFKSFGVKAEFSKNTLRIRAKNITNTVAPYALVKMLRASFWVLGPLIARAGHAQVALPGGDAIGTRPVDLHLQGLVKMGAEVQMKNGVVHAYAPGGLKPCTILLCLLYTSPSPRDATLSRMPSSA